MPDAEGAVERLYEDTAIRDELRDDEATLLLKWAEGQVARLAADSADDAFDESFDTLRGLMKAINRLIGQRTSMDEAALRARLDDLSMRAASVGATPSATEVGALASALPALDDAGAVRALTGLFTPSTPDAVALSAPATPTDSQPDSDLTPPALASGDSTATPGDSSTAGQPQGAADFDD